MQPYNLQLSDQQPSVIINNPFLPAKMSYRYSSRPFKERREPSASDEDEGSDNETSVRIIELVINYFLNYLYDLFSLRMKMM